MAEAQATKENIKNKAPSGRPERKPIGTTNRMRVRNQDTANFSYRWVNDVDDRVQYFLEAGYEVCDPKTAEVESNRIEGGLTADKHLSVGGGVKAVLMRQKREYYEEDQKAKQDAVDSQIGAITNPDLDGNYGKVSIGAVNSR